MEAAAEIPWHGKHSVSTEQFTPTRKFLDQNPLIFSTKILPLNVRSYYPISSILLTHSNMCNVKDETSSTKVKTQICFVGVVVFKKFKTRVNHFPCRACSKLNCFNTFLKCAQWGTTLSFVNVRIMQRFHAIFHTVWYCGGVTEETYKCCVFQVVQELALVMYAALDIGLKEDEERTLSPGLENLLAHMISAGRP